MKNGVSKISKMLFPQNIRSMEGKHSRKTINPHSAALFLRCAAVLLPYLTPKELASISSTCKTLYDISKSITSKRTLDASRGFETTPIPFLNPIAAAHPHLYPYSYFLYTPTQTLHLNPHLRQPWGSDHETLASRPDPFLFRVEGAGGCDCVTCGGDRCPCLKSGLVSRECGPSCECGLGCGNRVTQEGVMVNLKIVKDVRKGWGLCAAEFIPIGKFVCEYAGELLSTKEARQRQQMYDEHSSNPTLLVVKEHLPSGNTCMRINIDATRIGNVARFINHSCDGGNLDTVIVRSSGALLPRVCFFASREILEGEELAFSYGDVRVETTGQPCFCGGSSCVGILPSENT